MNIDWYWFDTVDYVMCLSYYLIHTSAKGAGSWAQETPEPMSDEMSYTAILFVAKSDQILNKVL